MISRSRSAPTVAAMSIECTTSANSTVTCLYSAHWVACVRRVPHSPQNLAVGLDCVPQEPQISPVAVSPPPPSRLGSTSESFHRCSAMSVVSPCHLQHEVLRLSYVVLRLAGQRIGWIRLAGRLAPEDGVSSVVEVETMPPATPHQPARVLAS